MKNTLHYILAVAAICTSAIGYTQIDSIPVIVEQKEKAEEETVIEGKNVRIIFKEKQVEKKTAEGKDTVTSRVESVEIVTKDGEEPKEDFEVVEGSEFIETSWNNFHLGLNNLLNKDGKLEPETGYDKMTISPANSINFQWDIVTQAMDLYKGKVRLVYGIGLDYNNYRFKNDISLNADSMVLFITEDGINYDKNKLVTQHINVPVMLNFKLSPKNVDEELYISAGANFGYLIRAHQKQVWDDNGKKKNKIRDDYNLEQFRVGYEVQFGYKNIILFGKYFPKSIFKTNEGPELRTVSAGILIGKV
jgi:hypothetical protein